MNAAQIHLALNHLPIAGVIFATLFLLYGVIRSSRGAKQAGLVLVILAGLTSLPVFFSGEGVEEIVEHKAGVTKDLIHNHEEAAELAFYMALVAAVSALGGLISLLKQSRLAQPLVLLTLVLGLGVAGLLANAAHLGGMIRHDEIRPEAAGIQSDRPFEAPPSEESEDADESL